MCVNPFWRKTKISPIGRYTSKAVKLNAVGSDKNGYYIYIPCPCGKCFECIQQNQKEWQFRLLVEDASSPKPSWFITLTYDNNNLPIVYRTGSIDTGEVYADELMRLNDLRNGVIDTPNTFTSIYPVLHKQDVQKYFKRIRRKLEYYSGINYEFKYFLVGEYGGRYNRPHYHLALLNFEAHDFIAFCNFLRTTWHQGIVRVQRLSAGRIKYVSKYMAKVDSRPHEVAYFRTMSKGIGLSYINDETIRYHRENLTKDVHIFGRKFTLPKYLCDRIFTEDDKRKMYNKNIENYFKECLISPEKIYEDDERRLQRFKDNPRIISIMYHHFVNSDSD